MRPGVIQFTVYTVAAIVFGYWNLMSVMVGVWGVRIHPLQYLALYSALGFFIAAIFSLFNARKGRITAAISVAGMSAIWLPSIVAFVPQPNTHISLIAPLIYLLFFGFVAFVLFYPKRWKVSMAVLAVTLIGTASSAGITAVRRAKDGQFDRPEFVFFRWYPNAEGIIVGGDRGRWIDRATRDLLQTNGIYGTLKLTGSSGQSAKSRIILIATESPSLPQKLFYPRGGTIVYAFDSSRWRKVPETAPTYSSFADLEPQERGSMIWQDAGGGRQGTGVFW